MRLWRFIYYLLGSDLFILGLSLCVGRVLGNADAVDSLAMQYLQYHLFREFGWGFQSERQAIDIFSRQQVL